MFCAMFLRMRLAMLRGAWREAEGLFMEMRGMITTGRDYYLLHSADMCRGTLYGYLGRLESMPEWLRNGDGDGGVNATTVESLFETELPYLAGAEPPPEFKF